MVDNTALYNLLSKLGVVEKNLLDEAWLESRQAEVLLADLLLDRDLISDESLGKILAQLHRAPYVGLEKMTLDTRLLDLLPEEMEILKNIVVFAINEKEVSLAMENPFDLATITLVQKKFRRPIRVFYSTKRDIRKAIFSYRRDESELFAEMANGDITSTDGSVVVEKLLNYAYRSRASDIHIEPFEEKLQVRFRVDGVLTDVVQMPKSLLEPVVSRVKLLLSGSDKFAFEIPEMENVEVRVSMAPFVNGSRVVMKLISGMTRQFALMDLGISDKAMEKIRKELQKPYGMILVAGPAESGKTTTLYSLLKAVNKRNVNIMTVEDPVEYSIVGVNQIQVDSKTDLTYAEGLKSIVKQDPSIIAVGEIEDQDTATIAVNAALTGHLVFSTLLASDAATTISRLLDMGPEPFLLSSTVNLIVSQRLVRRICPNCKTSKTETLKNLSNEIPAELVKKYLERRKKGRKISFGQGCAVCHDTGYLGRVGVFEVMTISDKIRKLIGDRADAQTIRDVAIAEGMESMMVDGLKKVKNGITTIDELVRVII